MYTVRQLTQPSVEPVDIPTAKVSCGVYDTTFDGLFQIWIKAAREAAEQYTNMSFFNRSMLLSMDYFPWAGFGNGSAGAGSEEPMSQITQFERGFTIDMPRPGLVSVESFTYTDITGTRQNIVVPGTNVTNAGFYIDTTSEPGRLVPLPGGTWPWNMAYVPGSLQITYTAGTYGDGVSVNNCPACVQVAILLLVGHMYQNRESVTILQGTVPSVLPQGFTMHLDTIKFHGKTFGQVR